MRIDFENVLQLIGCTSPKMKKIVDALCGDSQNSLRANYNAGKIDYNEYCKYDDKIATMIEDVNSNLHLHTYWLNDKGKPHLHYIFKPSQDETTYIIRRTAHNNSNFVGKILKQKEDMENGPLADVYVYDQSDYNNVFIGSGKLVGIAKYYMVKIKNEYYVHLVYKNYQSSKTDDTKINEVSTYYRVPDKLLEKMTQQSLPTNSLPEELKSVVDEDFPQEFAEKLLKNLESFIKGLEDNENDDTNDIDNDTNDIDNDTNDNEDTDFLNK